MKTRTIARISKLFGITAMYAYENAMVGTPVGGDVICTEFRWIKEVAAGLTPYEMK